MEAAYYCFICGGNIANDAHQGPPDKTDNLKRLVVRVCKLLNVIEIATEEWDFLTKPQQLPYCCPQCHDLMSNVESVHDIYLRTEAQLKIYLSQVKTLVTRSELRHVQSGAWHQSCLKFRRQIVNSTQNCSNATILARIDIKDEPLGRQNDAGNHARVLDEHYGDSNWDDCIQEDENDCYFQQPRQCDGRAFSEYDSLGNNSLSIIPVSETRPAQDLQEKPLDTLRTPKSIINTTLAKIHSHSALALPTSKHKRRKIVVIAQEDDKDEEIQIFDGKAANKISKHKLKSVAVYANYEGNDNSPYNVIESIGGLRGNSLTNEDLLDMKDDKYGKNEWIPCKKEEDEDSQVPIIGTNFLRKGRPLVLWVPILVAGENLFLYKYGTFIRYTYSHLQCMAHKCKFQTVFDYYPSFQVMRQHMEDNHRSRKHRQQIVHRCYICNTQFKNQDQLRKHFRAVHDDLKPTNAKAICESCLVITRNTVSRGHQWSHKNEAEKALARQLGDGNAKCFKTTEREMTEKKYVCDWENCTAAFKSIPNWKRHKRTHLPVEERTDMTLCTDCGERVLKEKLFDHMVRRHHPEMATRTLVCPVCDKRYLASDNALFQDHVKLHRGEKSFMCTQCAAVFVSNTRLTAHVKNAHGNETLPCPWCDKVYTKRISLIAHKKRQHTEKYNKYKRRPHTKKQSKFYYNEEVERALKEQFIGPIQKYPCPVCDVAFKFRHSIKKHMRQHEDYSNNTNIITKGRSRSKASKIERKVELGTSSTYGISSVERSNYDNSLCNDSMDNNSTVVVHSNSSPTITTVFLSNTKPTIFGQF